MNREINGILVAAVAWLCLALLVGATGHFRNVTPTGVAATVWGLTALALLMCWKAPRIREASADLDLRWLIALHLTRFVGIYFLVLGSRGVLNPGFARLAGVGDIIVAVGAVAILVTQGRDGAARRPYLLFLWNTFGLVDIIMVVFSAFRFGVADWASMAPLRELPLSLLPTFLVPLIIASHVLIYGRLRKL